MSRILSSTLLSFVLVSLLHGQRVGDVWITTRGDATPHISYSTATTTSSGRIIAVGGNGSLMFSDDGGSNWKYGAIEIEGVPVRGSYSAIFQVPGGNLIAVMRQFEESSVGFFDYHVRTYFLTSSDNGNTWSKSAFPLHYATFAGDGRRYYGVNITGLHMGPGGQLIAYGTTTGTNHPGAIHWNIGGAIFRQSGGSWTQAHFGYGPVGKVTNADGRAVAVSHNAILDSADGAGWNGYTMRAAQVEVDGDTMDFETKDRLRLMDIEVLDGTYIAQGATFVPFDDSGLIDTNFFDEIFKMSSPTPFSGARNWNAYPQDHYHGPFAKAGGNIISAGPGGAYITSDGGPGFTLAGPEVRAWSHTIAVSGSTAVAVQSSETVWKSTNSGAGWTKVWDKDVGPNLQILGVVNGVIYARATSNGNLWTSRDNGQSWQETAVGFKGIGTLIAGGDGRLISPGPGAQVQVSDDGGASWTAIAVPTGSASAFLMTRTTTGRIIVPAEGRDVQNEGKFFYSDDNGVTWTPVTAGLVYGEDVRAIVQTKSGRIIVATNMGSRFEPKLYFSDDNGGTWAVSTVLQSLDGLDSATGEPETKVFEALKLRAGVSGRIVALGENEILTSDDDGESWTVRINLNYETTGPNLHFGLNDVIQVGTRWIAVGNYRTPFPQNRNKHFLLISDDDGTTWGQTPFATNQANTFLRHLAVGPGGRLIIGGTNASIFVSDPEPTGPELSSPLSIREGETDLIPIERPGVDGAIEARYSAVERTAIAEVDFVPAAGILEWEKDDLSPKMVSIEAIDNTKVDGEREFLLQLVFETTDGLLGESETSVFILDNDAGTFAGLIFENAAGLYTTEGGASTDIRFALETKPTADATVTIEGLDASEGQLSETAFVFTPANWSQWQTLTVTGVDDDVSDGDITYNLEFSMTTEDTNYAALPPTKIAVTNIDDELSEQEKEALAILSGVPFVLGSDRTLTFTVPETLSGVAFSSEISTDLVDWSPGPVPVAGTPANGFTTYTITLDPPAPASFARIIITLEP